MNWQQEILHSEEREKQKRQGLERPFAIYVESVSSESEMMKVSYFGNRDKNLPLPHPFVSMGSWIRAMPENGTAYTSVIRIDESNPQPLNTIQRGTSVRIESYQKSLGLYRPLIAGEIEISSLGGAQVYASRRPILETRAGTVQRFTDQDSLSTLDRAPVHRKLLLQSKNNAIQDEYRLGVVQRPKSTWEFIYPKVRGNYSAEEYLHLANPAGSAPAVLYSRHHGHVLDIKGTQIRQTRTQVELRSREVWYANDDSTTTKEIDEKGNVFMRLAQAAVEGYEMEVPAGNWKLQVKQNYEAQINADYQLAVAKSSVTTVGATLKLEVSKDATYNYNGKLSKTITGETSINSTGALNLICSAAATLQSSQTMTVKSDADVMVQGSTMATFMGQAQTTVGSGSGITQIMGIQVGLGGGGAPVARLGDQVMGIGNLGLPVISNIVQGSTIVTSA